MSESSPDAERTSQHAVGVLSHFFPPDIGGIPRIHSYTTPHLHRHGMRMIVLTSGDQAESRIRENMHVERVPAYGKLFTRARAARLGVDRSSGASPWDQVVAHAVELFRAHDVSLVNSHIFTDLKLGITVAERLGVPHVHTAHSAYRSEAFVRQEAQKRGDTHAMKANDDIRTTLQRPSISRFIVHTEYMRDKYVGLGVPRHRIDIVRPGIDLQLFRHNHSAAAHVRSRLGLEDEIMITCPTLRKQGFDLLLKAYAKYRRRIRRPSVLVCTDTPTLPEKYVTLVESLGLTDSVICTQLPDSPATIMAGVFSASDVVVLCSTEEGIGLPALEARACGTPVIAHRFGPFLELVADGVDGLLVDTGDVDGLADSLEIGSMHGRDRSALVENGLNRARGYPHVTMAPSYAEVFRTALHEPPAGHAHPPELQAVANG